MKLTFLTALRLWAEGQSVIVVEDTVEDTVEEKPTPIPTPKVSKCELPNAKDFKPAILDISELIAFVSNGKILASTGSVDSEHRSLEFDNNKCVSMTRNISSKHSGGVCKYNFSVYKHLPREQQLHLFDSGSTSVGNSSYYYDDYKQVLLTLAENELSPEQLCELVNVINNRHKEWLTKHRVEYLTAAIK